MWVTVLRGGAVAALLSAFGVLVFQTVVLGRAGEVAAAARRVDGLRRWSLVVALMGLLGWVVAQAGAMAGAGTLGEALRAVPTVVGSTLFGRVWAAQVVGVVAALAMRRGAAWAAGFALGMEAGHGHAMAMEAGPSMLLAAEVVHLLAAGAWLGGLAPLLLVVMGAPAKAGAAAARWFSPMGKVCVVAVAGSALVEGWELVGGVPGLVGTGYGWVVGLKTVLFAALVGFAVVNRYRLAPGLRGEGGRARRLLVGSIGTQTGVGLAAVGAAAALSGMEPGMHVQPYWPFPVRFTWEVLGEDPSFFWEVVWALVAPGVAGALVGLAIWARRMRWVAVAAFGLVAWWAAPHLGLLFVPAYPTSFYQSPTGFSAASIDLGAGVYSSHCAACHGPEGRGDGTLAKGLAVPPADLTAGHLWMHSDGELFWWVSEGIEGPRGGRVMPGFAGVLKVEEVWGVIDFVRARNAGLAYRAEGDWPAAVRAPGFAVRCGAGGATDLAGLAGGVVRVVFGAAGALPGVVTVAEGVRPGAGLCAMDDGKAAEAYGVLAGGGAAGVSFLIDREGWLRAVSREGWSDPAALAREVGRIEAEPVKAPGMGGMRM